MMPLSPTAVAYPDADIAAAVARALAAARDRPNPVEDAGCSPEKYARLARDFRRSAWEHLDAGDLPQASNKAWGLVAETVKAVSAQHGGFIHSHGGIREVARELARLAEAGGDAATRHWINNSFQVARSLHANFYEDRAHEDVVLSGLMLCEELSERLYALFWPGGTAGAAVESESEIEGNGNVEGG